MTGPMDSQALIRYFALTFLAATMASPVRAEMVDHGALEALFGEPVTTSATGQPQRASEAPVNMVIISADDIRRSGARDLPGILKHVGGVDLLQWTNTNTDISIRGYNREYASRVLVLIDGRQVYADHFGFMPWRAIPVELASIRQIEVVKGPNAALFGFNAVGGVINIVTYNPMMDHVGSASARFGTQDFVGGNAVGTFHLGERFAFRLSAGAHDGNEFSTPIPPQVGLSRQKDDERTSLSADAVADLTHDLQLRFGASYTTAARNEIGPQILFHSTVYETNSVNAQLTADTSIGLMEATAYTNGNSHSFAPQAGIGRVVFDNRLSVLRLQDLFSVGTAHTIRLAAEYRYNTIETSPFTGADIYFNAYALSGMWDWKLSPTLSITNAVRLDRLSLGRSGALPSGYPWTNADWDRDLDEVSFNTGLVWTAGEAGTFRFIAGRGVHLPNLTEFGAILIDTPFLKLSGFPTLDPSTVTNFEVDWDRDIPALNATMRTAVFHQITEDARSVEGGIVPSATEIYTGPMNNGRSAATGLEFSLSGAFGSDWRWGLAYRAETVDDDFTPLTTGQPSTSNYEDTTPQHLINVTLGWTGGRWEADGFLRYQSDVSGVRYNYAAGAMLTSIDAYAAFDARLAYAVTDWATLALSGENLAASPQKQTAGPEVERVLMGTLTVNY